MTTYAVRRHAYRNQEGWHVGSRGSGGWPISIFVTQREGAEMIRDAYTAAERGFISAEERDLYVDTAFDAERVAHPRLEDRWTL